MPEPTFSPATKAEEGHDENIPFSEVERQLGGETAAKLRDLSLAIYERGREVAAEVGIIIADTKFEFGADDEGQIILIDEVMTPDSSRFWPVDQYAVGRGQPSLDKQPLRDHLEGLVQRGEWDKQPPAPDLPAAVIDAMSTRYQGVFERLTGTPLDEVDLRTWGKTP